MKINGFQQLGFAAMVGGALMLWMRVSRVVFPEWNVGGGTVTLKLPDQTWIDPALIIVGLLVLIVGTAWAVFRGRSEDHDEDEDRSGE